jgi:hypothetical protein
LLNIFYFKLLCIVFYIFMNFVLSNSFETQKFKIVKLDDEADLEIEDWYD